MAWLLRESVAKSISRYGCVAGTPSTLLSAPAPAPPAKLLLQQTKNKMKIAAKRSTKRPFRRIALQLVVLSIVVFIKGSNCNERTTTAAVVSSSFAAHNKNTYRQRRNEGWRSARWCATLLHPLSFISLLHMVIHFLLLCPS